MGCWLGTDGITGSSIREGEDTYALICLQREEVYCPVYFPILGKYNDYGQIEDIDARPGDFTSDRLLKYLNRIKKNKQIYRREDARDGTTRTKDIFRLD